MVYKTETKKFMNETGRFINVDGEEWLVVKDMFNWLGRLRKDGDITTSDKNKLLKFLRNIRQEECLKKFEIEVKPKKPRGRQMQKMSCIKFSIVEKHWDNIELLFSKKNICVGMRDEYSFINNVKDFFKYDKFISIETQVNIMEFRVDMIIGTSIFVEFDEAHHKKQTQEDIVRMQKIALANTYDTRDGYLCNTNDYKEMHYEHKEYDGFSTFEFNGAFFIRVTDKSCLTWIPLMYEHYSEYMNFLYEPISIPKISHSDELITMKYVS